MIGLSWQSVFLGSRSGPSAGLAGRWALRPLLKLNIIAALIIVKIIFCILWIFFSGLSRLVAVANVPPNLAASSEAAFRAALKREHNAPVTPYLPRSVAAIRKRSYVPNALMRKPLTFRTKRRRK